MFDFKNLAVYQKAKVFHVECKNIASQPGLERYVKDQLGRASLSVLLNIAEGSGKFSKPDRRNYLLTARGSIHECVACNPQLQPTGAYPYTIGKNTLEIKKKSK